MTVVVVPPLADPTLRTVVGPGERLLDLNQQFARRLADPQFLIGFAGAEASGADPEPGRLLVLAAADALAATATATATTAAVTTTVARDPMTRLRALGAAIRAVSLDDPGLTASVDDIELREGTTQSSAAVAVAAARVRLFDPELEAARPVFERGERVELVVDTDQQLPAAFALVPRSGAGCDVVLSGRFVAAHRAALGRVPLLAGVRFSDRIRVRYVPGVPDPERAAVWATEAGEVPRSGPWAGWLGAGQALRMTEESWARCAGVVVSAAGPADGRPAGSAVAGAADLLVRLAGRVPVALEVVVGDPARVEHGPQAAWWQHRGAGVRLAGFSRYRRPLPGTGSVAGTGSAARAGVPVGHDLARWDAEPGDGTRLSQAAAAAEEFAGSDLFPGRLAGALFAAPVHDVVADGFVWDPAVRLVRVGGEPAGGEPGGDPGPGGDFLVSLRTGHVQRVQPSLAQLVAGLRARGPQTLVTGMPPARRDALLSGLCRTGLVRRVAAA